jgi:hypothetical protein
VYEVQIHDYRNQRAYRMINPDYTSAHTAEAASRGTYNINEAWEDVLYTDLEVDDDWIQKALAVVSGEVYDTRISVPIDFSDEELLKYMKLAHEQDVTFNQLVETALREAIACHKS